MAKHRQVRSSARGAFVGTGAIVLPVLVASTIFPPDGRDAIPINPPGSEESPEDFFFDWRPNGERVGIRVVVVDDAVIQIVVDADDNARVTVESINGPAHRLTPFESIFALKTDVPDYERAVRIPLTVSIDGDRFMGAIRATAYEGAVTGIAGVDLPSEYQVESKSLGSRLADVHRDAGRTL